MTHLHEDWRERIGKFSERREEKHFYVIADDIFRTEVIPEALKAGGNYITFTFIGTTRLNEDRRSDLEGLGYKILCLDVLPLSKKEKQRILKKLEQDVDYADTITQLSAEQKQHFLNAPSMLVLMLQLSEGKPFHLIIEDVVMRLADTKENPARQIFGVLCNFYKFGIIVPEEILILCLPGFERRSILKVIDRAEHGSGDLVGLLSRGGVLGYEGLTTIHEIIAVEAIRLGRISNKSNYPYLPHDLHDYLSSIIQKLDAQNETHKRWLSFTFWALVLNDEITFVKGLLKTYSQEIERLCEAGNITSKYRWQRLYGKIQQYDDQERLIEQILLSNPQNSTDWIFWMKLFELYATDEEKRNVWMRIEKWLKDCIDFTVSFLSLIELYGTKKQKQEAIVETQKWLEKHSEATYVHTKYLALVEVYGTKDEKRQAIEETRKWLEKHLENTDVRAKYISLCGKTAKKIDINIKMILNEQWEWIKKQSMVKSNIWSAFLVQIYYFLLEESDLIQNAIKLAIVQHPDDSIIVCIIFGYFSDYLEEKDLCYRLAERIISLEYPHSSLLRNWVHAANFFRDEGEFEKAESVYQGLFEFCKNNVGEVYRKTYNFTSLSYAQLLVLKGKPDEALYYLKPASKQDPKNSFAYQIKARCLKAKGKYNEATECYEKSLQFVEYNKELYWYEYGCFIRNHLKDYEKAKECFEESRKQMENLPAFIELAEIELVCGNKRNAREFLKRGLNLKPKNRKEREKYKELEDRINAIHDAVK